jgi:uncharacterized RDD family membrane protein YckC
MKQFIPKPQTGRRVLATIIDYAVVFAFTFWYTMTFGTLNDKGGYTVSGFSVWGLVLFWGLWIVGTEGFCGQTLGHALVGLKVVSLDGSPISLGQSLKRRLCDAVEVSWCFGLLALILVKGTGNQQRLGDIIAKTYVVGKDQETLPEFEFESGLPLSTDLEKPASVEVNS